MIFFICALLKPQSGLAQPENSIGIINNFIIDYSDFQSGYTGSGLSFEYYLNPKYSLQIALNSFKINSSRSGFIKTRQNKITSHELYLAVRYHYYIHKQFSFFPQLAAGTWTYKWPLVFTGLGAEYPITPSLQISGSVNYLLLFEKVNFPGGWSSSMLKLDAGLNYLLSQ